MRPVKPALPEGLRAVGPLAAAAAAATAATARVIAGLRLVGALTAGVLEPHAGSPVAVRGPCAAVLAGHAARRPATHASTLHPRSVCRPAGPELGRTLPCGGVCPFSVYVLCAGIWIMHLDHAKQQVPRL